MQELGYIFFKCCRKVLTQQQHDLIPNPKCAEFKNAAIESEDNNQDSKLNNNRQSVPIQQFLLDFKSYQQSEQLKDSILSCKNILLKMKGLLDGLFNSDYQQILKIQSQLMNSDLNNPVDWQSFTTMFSDYIQYDKKGKIVFYDEKYIEVNAKQTEIIDQIIDLNADATKCFAKEKEQNSTEEINRLQSQNQQDIVNNNKPQFQTLMYPPLQQPPLSSPFNNSDILDRNGQKLSIPPPPTNYPFQFNQTPSNFPPLPQSQQQQGNSQQKLSYQQHIFNQQSYMTQLQQQQQQQMTQLQQKHFPSMVPGMSNTNNNNIELEDDNLSSLLQQSNGKSSNGKGRNLLGGKGNIGVVEADKNGIAVTKSGIRIVNGVQVIEKPAIEQRQRNKDTKEQSVLSIQSKKIQKPSINNNNVDPQVSNKLKVEQNIIQDSSNADSNNFDPYNCDANNTTVINTNNNNGDIISNQQQKEKEKKEKVAIDNGNGQTVILPTRDRKKHYSSSDWHKILLFYVKNGMDMELTMNTFNVSKKNVQRQKNAFLKKQKKGKEGSQNPSQQNGKQQQQNNNNNNNNGVNTPGGDIDNDKESNGTEEFSSDSDQQMQEEDDVLSNQQEQNINYENNNNNNVNSKNNNIEQQEQEQEQQQQLVQQQQINNKNILNDDEEQEDEQDSYQ